MILKLIAVGILTVVFEINYGAANSHNLIEPSKYPVAERNESILHTYPGSTQMADPYAWMEDGNSQKTKNFIKEEIVLTMEYFHNANYAEEIKARYAELWKLEKFDAFFRKGGKYFSYKSTDADKQDILYVHDEPFGNDREFLNANKLGSAYYSVTLQKASSAFSPDGKVFAYLTYDDTSNSNSIQFKHLENGMTIKGIYKEKLRRVTNSKVAWMKNDGIFYLTHDPSNGGLYILNRGSNNKIPKLYYHKLGTEQEKDVLVAKLPNNDLDYRFSFEVTDDDKYMIVSASKGSKNQVLVAELTAVTYQMKNQWLLVGHMKAKYEFVTNIGSQLIFRTNKDAPYYKLASVNARNKQQWRNVVPENDFWVLDWAKPAWNKYIVLAYVAEDIRSVLQLFDLEGSQIMTFELEVGTVKAESFYSDKKNSEIYFKFESFFTPCIIYYFDLTDLSSPKPEKIKEIAVPNFNLSDYDVKFVNVPIKQDMVTIPTYIAHKKDIKLDGKNFTFLTAIGGFGANLLPYFSINNIVVLKNLNGILALANIRGGGEKGEKWHISVSTHNKQKSMNDFQAVAKYLIQSNYTSPKLLAIYGGDNGISGPLIGASLNQRPDLFGAVIAEAGTMDMLRFDQFDIGRDWIFEYGSPRIAEDFKYLKAYSPLHNVNIDKTQYPPTMLLTSIEDDRVPAFHSLKFIATLQNEAKKNSIQKNPLIVLIHWLRRTKTTLAEAAKVMTFIVMNIGIEFNT